jgi:NAD(P)-dependent dehydrogenase (short-subunit alcohol dehydrogenase family)
VSSFSGVALSGVSVHPVPAEQFSAAGLRVAVVGGTGGIGRAIARLLASRGALVTVVGRTFRDAGTAGLTFVEADLSSTAQARRVGDALPAETLDAVIFTTGIITGKAREVTAEGFERDLAVSYLSRVEILRRVAPRLGTARGDPKGRPRVFVMGFPGTENLGNAEDLNSEQKYEQFPAHMNTVGGNEALVLDAARRFPHLGVFGLNPGLVPTDIRAPALGGTGSLWFRVVETLIGWCSPTPESYAARIVPVLFAPALDGLSGIHFNQKGTPIRPSQGMTDAYVAKLIGATDALLARTTAR